MNLNLEKNENSAYYRLFFVIGMCIFSLSLSWSMLFTSLSVIILGAALVIKIEGNKPFVSIYSDWRFDFKKILTDPIFLILLFVFFTVFLSGFWSIDKKQWSWFSRMMLPFLIVPFVLLRIGSVQKKWIHIFWLLCIACLFYTSLFIVKDYIFNGDKVNQIIMKGGAITTPISHIRYSLIVACVIIILLDWIIKKSIVKYEYEKWVYILLFLYFFGFIHLLSVKSGIVGLYLGLFLYFSAFLLYKNKFYLWIVMVILLIGTMYAAYELIPSFKSKIAYSLWQYSEWKKGKWLFYSDIERWVSIQIGWEIITKYPLLGTGIGDLDQLVKETYYECLNHKDVKFPHNQFIFSWASCGILGLLSILGLVYLGFQKKYWKFPLVLGLQGILLSSFLWEMTLQTQMGVCIYLYFTMTAYLYSQDVNLSLNFSSIESKA